jgi:hypothetical protein
MTTSIGGLFTSPPEIVSWGPSEINLFAFAVGTDQALWYAQLALLLQGIMPGADGSLWGAWSCLVRVPCDRESCPLTSLL